MPSAYVVKRKSRNYAVKVYLGDGKSKWIGGFETREDAKAYIAHLASNPLTAANQGLYGSSRLRVAKYLEDWLSEQSRRVKRGELRQRTLDRYSEFVRVHIVPEIGHLPLTRVGPQAVKTLIERRLESGSAPRTAHHLFMLLHKAFADAVFDGIIAQNPCARVKPPKVERSEFQVWSESETLAFLAEAERYSRFPTLWLVECTTGLRLGEVLGLRWRDVNFDRGALQVRQSVWWPRGGGHAFTPPKSSASRRNLSLPSTALEALRTLRRERATIDPEALIFCQPDGEPLRSKTVRADFLRTLRRAGLPAIRIHDVRHSHLSHLAARGLPVKTLQERGGHSAASFTMQVYAHALPGAQDAAAAAMEDMLNKQNAGPMRREG